MTRTYPNMPNHTLVLRMCYVGVALWVRGQCLYTDRTWNDGVRYLAAAMEMNSG